jgi:hypothetical protein
MVLLQFQARMDTKAGGDKRTTSQTWLQMHVASAHATCIEQLLFMPLLLLQFQARTDTKAGGGKRKKGDDGGRGEKRQRTAKRPYD